jgi:hypothetical protein
LHVWGVEVGVIKAGRERQSGQIDAKSKGTRAMVAKGVIVLVAFPVLAHAVFTLTSLVLGMVLPSLLPLAGSWSDLAAKAAVVATFLVALRVSFGVCRRMWPITV